MIGCLLFEHRKLTEWYWQHNDWLPAIWTPKVHWVILETWLAACCLNTESWLSDWLLCSDGWFHRLADRDWLVHQLINPALTCVLQYIGSFSVTGADEDARARQVESQLESLRVSKTTRICSSPTHECSSPTHNCTSPTHTCNSPTHTCSSPTYTCSSSAYTCCSPNYTCSSPNYTWSSSTYTSSY